MTHGPVAAVASELTDADLLGYFDRLSNWGRWGSADQRGTLNLIQGVNRADAARLIRSGTTISCSRVLSPSGPKSRLLHFMVMSGESAPDGASGSADWIGLPIHWLTHVDALSHIFWNGQIYNGASAKDVTTPTGAGVGSIELLADGLVTRGVLLDVPRAQGREWLEPGEPVHAADLDACAAAEGVTVTSGDVLLVRTGHQRHQDSRPGDELGESSPGLHASCLPWLHEHGVAAIGSDAANDVRPSGFAGIELPVHTVGMVAMGLWILDNLDLERLSRHCAENDTWEFFFAAAPLYLKRATGSPVNPIAIF